MELNVLKFIGAIILASANAQAVSTISELPLKIDGDYKQAGTCTCMEYSQENSCEKIPLAIQAIGTYTLTGSSGSAVTGETVVDPKTGIKKDITVWLYPNPNRGNIWSDEFRVRESDELLYHIKVNDLQKGYDFTVDNLTLVQPAYPTKIIIPENQLGGQMDGPADVKTVVTVNELVHHYTTRAFTAGDESAGPPIPFPVPGVIVNQAHFSITKLADDSIMLTQIYNNQIQKKGIPIVTYHYDYLACRLQKIK